jgi:hypothetical protein
MNPLDHGSFKPGRIIAGECPEYSFEVVETPEPVVKSNKKKKPKSILDLF